MKPLRFFMPAILFVLALPLMGCDPKENGSHGPDTEKNGSKEEEAEHEESPSGASFKPGKGILLTDETRKILGIETVGVTEENLPQIVRFNVQIFGETHRFAYPDVEHAECDLHGSGYLPPERASLVKPKQQIKIQTAANETVEGFVLAVKEALAGGETEIVVGVNSAGTKIKDGEFVTAVITLPRTDAVMVIPISALLRTVEGSFVYALNGQAYYRTTVKVGSHTDDKIEITDGLFAGDEVVTTPVETLWLIELRATKGGGHSH